MVDPDGQAELFRRGKREGNDEVARHLDLYGSRDRHCGLRAVRCGIGARIAEAGVRGAGEHAGRGREAHAGRQLPPGASEGIHVGPDAAGSSRQCRAVVDPDGQAELFRRGKREGNDEVARHLNLYGP